MKKYYRKVFLFLLLLSFLVLLFTMLYFFSPEEIINKIGVRNAFLFLFVISFFGGFSAFGSVSFIATLITFTLGGLNPIYLGLIAGTALVIGDLIMFYIGSKGRELVVGKWEKRIDSVSKFVKKRAGRFIPVLAYIYIGFVPLPNDVLILFLAGIEYPRKKIYLPIILGDLTFTFLVVILTLNGIFLF